MPPLEDLGDQTGGTNQAARMYAQRNEVPGNVQDIPTVVDMDGYKSFAVSAKELSTMGEESSLELLENLGGVSGLARKLEVNLKSGIDGTEDDIIRRQRKFGTNTHPEKPPRTLWFFVWETMQDTLLQILFICGIASIAVSIPGNGIAEGFYDGSGIFIALFIIITVSSISNYRQSQQFYLLNQEKAKTFTQVTRSGRRQRIPVHDIVVGDVAHLSIGDQVPADGILVGSHAMTIDESSMTGESELVHKDSKQHPFVIAGCTVMDGFGDMLVTGVGMYTEWGRTMSVLTEENDEETPLQMRLTKVATLMGQMGLVVGIALFLVLAIRYVVEIVDLQNVTSANISTLLSFFTVAVTVLVIAIPEGLPLAVALTLAFSVRKMMVDKSLVRHLAACETMGSATTICSDKTGTLTLNQMAVTTAWIGGGFQTPAEIQESFPPNLLSILHEGIAQNSSGSVYQPQDGGRTEVSGSPTESAILEWGVQLGLSFESTRASSDIVEVQTFSSEKKTMAVLVRDPLSADGAMRCHWKGAAEVLLESCDWWVDQDGNRQPITTKKAELLGVISNLAHSALRCICLAYHDLPPGTSLPSVPGEPDRVQIPSTGLTFLAVVGIKDPCRPEVPESVRTCQQAGIKVRLVTGDNLETACAIANECGILTPGSADLALLGSDFRARDELSLLAVLPRLAVLARASPGDKLRLVQLLQAQQGEVVAVTGDGTNDAPALYQADIGLAMGLCGTEVAKQSADIIILDDNFSSIVKTVTWGRSVYRNIQKFLQFQITTTVVAIGLNFVAALVSGNAPLTAVQMLWVDLIQDTFGALALASEPPTQSLLKEAPVDKRASLVTPAMWRNIIGQSVYQLGAMLCLWFHGEELLGLKGAQAGDELVTIIFCTFVFCQIFNEINSRKLHEWNVFEGLIHNHIFLLILAIEVLCQIAIVNVLGDFSGTVQIPISQWGLCVLIGALGIPWGLLVKLIPLPTRSIRSKKQAMGMELAQSDERFHRL